MLISTDNLCFGFNGEPLLENITFTLSETDRVGLIGGNGEGKTTLIRLLLSELEAESGSLFVKNGMRAGYLAQNGGYDSENTVFEEMREVFAEDIKAIDALRETEKKIAFCRCLREELTNAETCAILHFVRKFPKEGSV